MFNKKNQTSVPLEITLETRYKSARIDLLIVIALTVVNFFMLFFGDGTYFLFSAAVPYNIAINAMYLCGKLPPEYYQGDMFITEFLGDTVFAVMIAIAVIILALYALCFFMSSKLRVGWLIAALVLFSVDTLAMLWLYGISADIMVDLLMHVVVIVCLAMGVHAAFKLRAIRSLQIFTSAEPGDSDDLSHFFENNG